MGEFEDKLNSILSSPKDMEKILGLARELGGAPESVAGERPVSASKAAEGIGALGDIDPKLFKAASRVLGEYSSQKSDKTALVRSIKPYIRKERCKDLDRAVELAKLARIAKLAFSEFSGGESDL